jgi:hypothetical protein
MAKQLAVSIIVDSILSTCVAFALGRVSDPAPAKAEPRAEASRVALVKDYALLSELRRVRSKLDSMDHELLLLCLNTLPPGKQATGYC